MADVWPSSGKPDLAYQSWIGTEHFIYSWDSSEEFDAAKFAVFLAKLPSASKYIGVCLDTNAEKANKTIQKYSLPGRQLVSAQGGTSLIAQRLMMTRPGLIYRIGADGIISSVSFQQKFLGD
jgi:hypothetical protein